MPTDNATLSAVEQLPTVEDDATVQQLNDSLEQLAEDKKQTAQALATAKAEAKDAAAEVEDLEIEQYADPGVSASDVEAARKRLASEQDEVQRLEQKADRITKAISRVNERRREEKDGAAGKRMYDTYAPVALATAERAVAALREALGAVEAMNALRAKAKHNNVRPSDAHDLPAIGGTILPLTSRNNDTLADALRYALERAEQPVEGLHDRLS